MYDILQKCIINNNNKNIRPNMFGDVIIWCSPFISGYQGLRMPNDAHKLQCLLEGIYSASGIQKLIPPFKSIELYELYYTILESSLNKKNVFALD